MGLTGHDILSDGDFFSCCEHLIVINLQMLIQLADNFSPFCNIKLLDMKSVDAQSKLGFKLQHFSLVKLSQKPVCEDSVLG